MEKKELALGDGMLEAGDPLIFADKQWHLQTGCATRGEPVDNNDRMKPNEEMVSFPNKEGVSMSGSLSWRNFRFATPFSSAKPQFQRRCPRNCSKII